MVHIERYFKVYTGLTMAYGFLRAAQYRETPENVTALTVASPAIWPVYVINDTLDRLCWTLRQTRWED